MQPPDCRGAVLPSSDGAGTASGFNDRGFERLGMKGGGGRKPQHPKEGLALFSIWFSSLGEHKQCLSISTTWGQCLDLDELVALALDCS